MLTRRSGALSRFLVFRGPEFWAMPLELLFFNLLCGLLPLLIAIPVFSRLGAEGAGALLDPRDPIQRLTHAPPPGTRHLRARVAGGELCLVTHERKQKEWSEDWSGTAAPGLILALGSNDGDGEPQSLAALGIDRARFEWEPRLELRESALARRRHPTLTIPTQGRVLEGCLGLGDRLFLEILPVATGEAPDGAILLGPTGPRVVISPGDGTPRGRVANLAAGRAARVSLLGYAVLLVLLAGWRLTGARPFVAALERRLLRPLVPLASRGALWSLAATSLVLLLALWAVPSLSSLDGRVVIRRGPWVVAHFAAVSAIIVALRMSDRRALLGAVGALVRGPRPSPKASPAPSSPAPSGASAPAKPGLGRAREGEAFALDLVIDPAAPVSPGPISGKPRAHWAVEITRLYRSGANYSADAPRLHPGPAVVPVTADPAAGAGRALLDLTHVTADLRAIRRVVRVRAVARGLYQDVIGPSWTTGSSFVLEERFLSPGEPVHVLGRVVRFEPGDGPEGKLPVLGGTAGEPLVIHAGTRRSLLRGILVERAFLTAAIPACAAITLAMAAVSAYLGSR